MLKNLKKLREEACVSQQALANAIGVSQQSINKYENHNIEPDISTLIQIADFFSTSVDFLIGHSEIRRKVEAVEFFELNEAESQIICLYRALSSPQRAAVTAVIKSYFS